MMQLADLYAKSIRPDGFEVTAMCAGCIRLDIVGLHVRITTNKPNKYTAVPFSESPSSLELLGFSKGEHQVCAGRYTY